MDTCPDCKAPIIYGDKKGIEGNKVVYPKFEPDGKTLHACKPKYQFSRAPKKLTYWVKLSVNTTTKERIYEMSLESYQGEKPSLSAFNEVEAAILEKIKVDSGSAVSGKGDPPRR